MGLQEASPDPANAPLLAPRSHQLKDALEIAGYAEERARALAQKSGGNLGSLLRCLQNLSLIPEWAQGSATAELTGRTACPVKSGALLGQAPSSKTTVFNPRSQRFAKHSV